MSKMMIRYVLQGFRKIPGTSPKFPWVCLEDYGALRGLSDTSPEVPGMYLKLSDMGLEVSDMYLEDSVVFLKVPGVSPKVPEVHLKDPATCPDVWQMYWKQLKINLLQHFYSVTYHS